MKPVYFAIALAACGHSHGQGDVPDAAVGVDSAMIDSAADAPVTPTGAGVWQGHGVGTGGSAGSVLAMDTDGSVVAAGLFSGSLDFGNGAVSARGDEDFFVVKYDANGTLQWSRALGGCGHEYFPNVTIGPDHSVYLVGYAFFEGTQSCDLYFNSTRVPTGFAAGVASDALIVARYAADGTETWATSFGVPVTNMDDIAVTAYGDTIAIAANTAYDLTLGTKVVGPYTSGQTPQTYATALALLSSDDGSVHWATSIGSQGYLIDLHLAMDDGQIVVAGTASDAIDVGAPQSLLAIGNSDAVVASYSVTDGHYLWSHRLGGTTEDHALGIARVTDGSYWLTGWFTNTASFGGPELTTDKVSCGYAAHLQANGDLLGSFPTLPSDFNRGLATAGFDDGVVVVGGDWTDGAHEVAVATRYDGQGNQLWSHVLGNEFSDAQAVVTGPHGSIVVAGSFSDMLAVPGLPQLSSTSNPNSYSDAYIVRLAP